MGKIEEGIEILKALGLPRTQQNERSSLTLLALLDLKKEASWAKAKKRIIRIHDILVFIQRYYGKKYAENTRETIRRQTLHQFEQGGIVVRNPDDPLRPTNSPNTVYAIAGEALEVISHYDTSKWKASVLSFVRNKGRLVEKYEKVRKKNLISLDISEESSITFSPGKHNELQVRIIKDFKPRFGPKTDLIYVGDTARKLLFLEKELLKVLRIPITKHDKLPDVVLYDKQKNHLFLIEAVTAHGPISPKRQIELEKTLKDCKAIKIYISVFPDFREFKRHIDNIAWETEAWIAENPDHMIHFNGPRFFPAYGA